MGLVLEEAAQGKLRETPEGASLSVEPFIFHISERVPFHFYFRVFFFLHIFGGGFMAFWTYMSLLPAHGSRGEMSRGLSLFGSSVCLLPAPRPPSC